MIQKTAAVTYDETQWRLDFGRYGGQGQGVRPLGTGNRSMSIEERAMAERKKMQAAKKTSSKKKTASPDDLVKAPGPELTEDELKDVSGGLIGLLDKQK